MDNSAFSQIGNNLDYNTILPIHQKRTITFVNHFIMTTVEHLNNFAVHCENMFMQFEYKLQKIEASLLILESQLSSIADLKADEPKSVSVNLPEVNISEESVSNPAVNADVPEKTEEEKDSEGTANDPRYAKYFKLLKAGVPLLSFKQKMISEGLDPDILQK